MKLLKSFNFSINGIKLLLKEQNFVIHLFALFVVILGAIYLELNYLEWIVLLLTCGFVISLEAINTAIEKMCDLISKEKKKEIKTIKDISAASVLIQAIISISIALVLFSKM
ncbi:MAG: diacylglycerol kinase family protein [Crocinitomicaceae bacterium]|nr:diacylglycerol kinase family protein [Crocinitomicaceae bacterium]